MLKAKRFVYWRRAPEELYQVEGIDNGAIDTLENKVRQAKAIIDQGEYETVMILEIKKIVTRAKTPVTVKDF